MRTLIVDDERLARKELQNLLVDFPEIEVIDEAVNADDAREKIKKHNPDLVFLDIQMPGQTGFDLLETLPNMPRIIFTTAYDEYAIRAFEFNALDYLLKPIEPTRLREAVGRAQEGAEPESEEENEEVLSGNDQVFVKDGDRCWFVTLSKVRMFESEGNYVRVYFENNKPLILKSLNNLEKRLDPKMFFRANRKHIINLKWVEKIDSWFNGGLMVQLKGEDKIEISRRQAVKFKERMSL